MNVRPKPKLESRFTGVCAHKTLLLRTLGERAYPHLVGIARRSSIAPSSCIDPRGHTPRAPSRPPRRGAARRVPAACAP